MHINICSCDWGVARLPDIHALLLDTASHINRELRQPFEGTINVLNLPNQECPRTLYRQSGKGPYDINLTARDRKWARFAYQFAHEFCHVLSGYEHLKDNPNNWFHESICELASLYTLRRMGERWPDSPPFSGWADYAPHLATYAANITSSPLLADVSNLEFTSWLMVEESALREDAEQRDKNLIITCRLLDLFEQFPNGWNSITAFPASRAGILDYLEEWQATVHSADKPFVDQVRERLIGGLAEDTVEQLQHLVRSNKAAARYRGAASFRHAPNAFQDHQEVDACRDLRRSLLAQGKDDIGEPRKNQVRKFPDCLAEPNGDLIGIEVCELMDSHQANTAWSLDRFCSELNKIIRTKDRKAAKRDRPEFLAALSKFILLVHTDEAALTPNVVGEYLDQACFPKPQFIDLAYVLGPYQPVDRSVNPGSAQQAADSEPRFTAVLVAWAETNNG